MHMRFGWLAVIAIAASASLAHADCAQVELGGVLITRTGAKIPAGGGILVGIGRATDHKVVAGDASQNALTLVAKKAVTGLVMESLAPGLTVYRPVPKAATGAISVKDRAGTRIDVTFDSAKGAAIAAPVTSSVTVTSTPSGHGQEKTTAIAAVASVPDAAVALVVYATKDDEHVPITSGIPAHDKTGATTVVVYRGGGHCGSPSPPGEAVPTAGDEVTLAWVDAFGRLSPISDAVTVK